MHRLVTCLFALALAAAVPGPRAQDEKAGADVLSPRNASYTIQVRLDAGAKTLAGSQVLTWRNLQARPTAELRFHLYWNAFRNSRSSWMLEDLIRGRSDRGNEVREEDWGWVEVDSIRLLSTDGTEVDLSDLAEHVSPDDGNPDDRTVLRVALPAEVAPGATVRVAMDWRAKIPRTFARSGYRGNDFLMAHWFPKLGVFEADGWNCRQFHAATEFFSDFGSYDVEITLPEDFILGATGRQASRTANGDGTVSIRHVQDDVHEFAWTASPNYVVREARFEEPGLPPVDLRLLIQPDHLHQAERHLDAAWAALRRYGTWYGPYPYGHVTFLDPGYGTGFDGMEYPTLFTCGTSIFAPLGGDRPESVTIHEAGHQFWYGIVGNDEFEDAWIDEGLNTFSTLRTLDTDYGDRIFVARYLSPPREEEEERSGLLALPFAGIGIDRWDERRDRYRPSAFSNVQADPTYLQHPGTAADITYSKTALWLRTLERHLGWEVLQPILSTFFQRYRFSHPEPEDFLAVADEVSGQDLSWFFDQVFRSAARFDYAVDSVSTAPASLEGFAGEGELRYAAPPDDEDAGERGPYRSQVVVRRLGEGVFPVDVLMVFEDGEEIRERWDGEALWKLYVVERPSKLSYAVVDPDRILLLDLSALNNSLRVEPDSSLPAVKWASKWTVWLQDLMMRFTFFV